VKLGAAFVLAVWIIIVLAFANGLSVKVELPPAMATAQ